MEDPVSRAIEHIRRRSSGGPIPRDLRVTLNFHPDITTDGLSMIEGLARDGVYRSQFETGTSNGGLTAHPGGERWLWENRLFGGAYDQADLALRPKYGALNHRNDPVGGSRRFGSCHLRLKPTVLTRTTFCYPDSHLHPDRFGVADRMALIALADANASGLEPLDDYVEAHVHGPVTTAEDVEAVVLDPSYRSTAVETLASRLGCAVEWHQGFSLSLGWLDDCKSYRGAAAAQTLAELAKGEHGRRRGSARRGVKAWTRSGPSGLGTASPGSADTVAQPSEIHRHALALPVAEAGRFGAVAAAFFLGHGHRLGGGAAFGGFLQCAQGSGGQRFVGRGAQGLGIWGVFDLGHGGFIA